MRNIRVTGKGQIKVHPDMTRVMITLKDVYTDYGELLRRASEDTRKMKKLLATFGFEGTDVKTLSFNVDTEYERYKEKDVYKQRFYGYKYRHLLKVEFDSDNERLGKILYALTNSSLHPEFKLVYFVKDQEKVKNELLGNAVKDAVAKAEVLSAAAGQKLGEIQSIDYSWGRIDFEVSPAGGFGSLESPRCLMEDDSLPLDLEPDDVQVQDTVTVVWEIE